MRKRSQSGYIVRISGRWYVRYWESRNVDGKVVRKRASHLLGPITTKGKKPPAEIVDEAERHMASVKGSAIVAERVVTIGDFVTLIYLPWIEKNKRPSTAKGYRDIWEDHLHPLCAKVWLKNVRTYHAQKWLEQIGEGGLSRNTLKHIKSVISAIFTLAKQQDYFQGENPARGTAVNPKAPEPSETYAYSLDEIQAILTLLPEPAATAFAVAAYTGLRHGEIQGLRWGDYKNGELKVARSRWNGRETDPKTRKSRAGVPVIKQLAERLELHRLRSGDPLSGPIFANALGKPLALGSVVSRVILPTLNRCERCGKLEADHTVAGHEYKRDEQFPEWHGWHAARRGLGSNLYRLGVPIKVIQAILRHANPGTTSNYYIKTADDDVREAMIIFQNEIANTAQNTAQESTQAGAEQHSIQ
jgi:integrase